MAVEMDGMSKPVQVRGQDMNPVLEQLTLARSRLELLARPIRHP